MQGPIHDCIVNDIFSRLPDAAGIDILTSEPGSAQQRRLFDEYVFCTTNALLRN